MEYIQSYFEGFKNAGISTMFEIHRMNGETVIEKFSFDHVQYDGISAVLEVARRFPQEGFSSPKLVLKPKPPLLYRLKELAKWYGAFYPFMPPKWKTYSGNPTDVVSASVEIENWHSTDPKISVNTKLLHALDVTSQEYLTNGEKPRVWMTPVGLYNGVDRNLPPSNRVSFIDIKIKKESSEFDIQESARRRLMELHYWGTIMTMRLPQIIGKFLFRLAAKNMHLVFRRTGTFSNMGEWRIPGIDPKEWWVFGRGCVARMSPVEGTAMVVNGRMGISIHFDPSLKMTPDDAQIFVKRWKENYLLLKSKA